MYFGVSPIIVSIAVTEKCYILAIIFILRSVCGKPCMNFPSLNIVLEAALFKLMYWQCDYQSHLLTRCFTAALLQSCYQPSVCNGAGSDMMKLTCKSWPKASLPSIKSTSILHSLYILPALVSPLMFIGNFSASQLRHVQH